MAVEIVEAARFWGGQPLVLSRAKLSHYRNVYAAGFFFPVCRS
jgi:hypothetical protein